MPSPSSPQDTTHLPTQQKAQLASAHRRLATCSRLLVSNKTRTRVKNFHRKNLLKSKKNISEIFICAWINGCLKMLMFNFNVYINRWAYSRTEPTLSLTPSSGSLYNCDASSRNCCSSFSCSSATSLEPSLRNLSIYTAYIELATFINNWLQTVNSDRFLCTNSPFSKYLMWKSCSESTTLIKGDMQRYITKFMKSGF